MVQVVLRLGCPILGLVHKLRLTKEGVGSPKNRLFVNVYKVEYVNREEWMVKKSQKLVNVDCERPLERRYRMLN